MTIDEIRLQAMQLSMSERELLAVDLLGSLNTPETEAEIHSEWATEITARSNAFRAGKTDSLDAYESLDRVRSQFISRTSR